MDSIDIYNYNDCKVAIINKKRKKNYLIKMNDDFFYPSKDAFYQVVDPDQMEHIKRITDNPVICIAMVMIIFCSLIYYFLNNSFVIVDRNFIVSTLIPVLREVVLSKLK